MTINLHSWFNLTFINLFFSSVLCFNWPWWKTKRGMVFGWNFAIHVGCIRRGLRRFVVGCGSSPRDLYHRNLHHWGWRQSTQDQDQKSDLCHFLWSCRHLWSYHRHRFVRTNWTIQCKFLTVNSLKKLLFTATVDSF